MIKRAHTAYLFHRMKSSADRGRRIKFVQSMQDLFKMLKACMGNDEWIRGIVCRMPKDFHDLSFMCVDFLNLISTDAYAILIVLSILVELVAGECTPTAVATWLAYFKASPIGL